MRGPLVAIVLAAAAAMTAGSATVPLPVVERHLVVEDRLVRLSLFDDRVVVVSIREGGERRAYHQRRLDEWEYRDILDRLAELEGRVRSMHLGDLTLEGTSATIRLTLPNSQPRIIDYSLVRYQDPDTGALISLLDRLQQRVTAPPVEDLPDLASWNPTVGQRVVLRTGTIGVVAEVHPSGLIVLEEEGSELMAYVTPEHRTAIIRRVLEDEE